MQALRTYHMARFVVMLAENYGEDPVECEVIEAPTHVLASKAAGIRYPDLKVVEIHRRWQPVDTCGKCGGPIFKGDYADSIRKRNGSNRCLDCG